MSLAIWFPHIVYIIISIYLIRNKLIQKIMRDKKTIFIFANPLYISNLLLNFDNYNAMYNKQFYKNKTIYQS